MGNYLSCKAEPNQARFSRNLYLAPLDRGNRDTTKIKTLEDFSKERKDVVKQSKENLIANDPP